jgi:signal transduction histidine kinase
MISIGIAAAIIAAAAALFTAILYATKRIGDLTAENGRLQKQTAEVTQMKKNFISHVSHELKAPLASMQETTQLLLERIPGPLTDKQKRLLELNLQSGKRLGQMIGNVLELSRLEAGTVEYDFQPHDVTDLVDTVIEERRSGAIPIQILVETGSEPLMVACDFGLLMESFEKLLENALSVSSPEAGIRVQVSPAKELPSGMPSRWRKSLQRGSLQNGFVFVSITDSGPSLDESQKELIFESFDRPSLGLGLPIARALVEAHQGAIWIEDNPGGGNVVCVLLPRLGVEQINLARAS